ncbi:hypothetical protein RI129_006374 [Pyrocoelia pectoralis]|uniref:Uncharacterized protein n=1 Tax=Pyrocoelia pectoralis TaxID=417401 RepID=A0AAN7VJP3_9COLE
MRLLIIFGLVAIAAAFPQREGGAYTNEAIRQAQNSQLIPKDAQIQKVEEGIELGAYENIPGGQRIELLPILGDQLPAEVVNDLQARLDVIGRH